MAGHTRQKLNLTGQRFGKLIVPAPAEDAGSMTGAAAAGMCAWS